MTAEPQRQHYNLTFAILAVGATAYSLLQSLVVPALPTLRESLHASESGVTWVLTAYLLSASIATPVLGRLGDMYGKERMLVITLALLGVGTLMSALATSMPLMLAGRAVQGAGGGIFPLAFGIIRDEFPRHKVAGGLGLMSSLLGIGGGAGVVLAGLIVQHLNYHWLFWLPLVVIILATIATWRFVPESPVKVPGKVNWLSGALMTVGIVSVLVAVSETIDWGWGSPKTIGMIAFGLVVSALWILVEVRSKEPLIDMSLMRLRGIWTTNAVAFLLGAGMYSAFILIPQFVQEPHSTHYGFGTSIVSSGLFLLPSTLAMVVVSQFAGAIDARFGSRLPLILGCISATASFALMVVGRDTKLDVYVSSLLLGIGIGLAFSALANLVVEAVRQDQTGVATGMNTVMRTLGGALGGQIAATFLANDVIAGHPTDHAYGLAFGVCAVALAAAVAACLLIPSRRQNKNAAVGVSEPASHSVAVGEPVAS